MYQLLYRAIAYITIAFHIRWPWLGHVVPSDKFHFIKKKKNGDSSSSSYVKIPYRRLKHMTALSEFTTGELCPVRI